MQSMTTLVTLPASQARARLYPLIDEVSENGPVQILGRRGSAILVSQAEWDAMSETLHIASQPAVMAKIRASQREPRSKMKTLDQIT
jgi:prevent-host-death family protein